MGGMGRKSAIPTAADGWLSPARVTILAFETASALAELLGVDRSTVGRWDWPKEKRGTGGVVPAKYHKPILALATAHRKDLTPAEIIFGRAA